MVLYISKSIAIFIKLNAKWTNNNILFTHKYAGEKNQIKWFMNVWYENHFLMPTKKNESGISWCKHMNQHKAKRK